MTRPSVDAAVRHWWEGSASAYRSKHTGGSLLDGNDYALNIGICHQYRDMSYEIG